MSDLDRVADLTKRAWRRYWAWPVWARIVVALFALGVIATPFSQDTRQTSAPTSPGGLRAFSIPLHNALSHAIAPGITLRNAVASADHIEVAPVRRLQP